MFGFFFIETKLNLNLQPTNPHHKFDISGLIVEHLFSTGANKTEAWPEMTLQLMFGSALYPSLRPNQQFSDVLQRDKIGPARVTYVCARGLLLLSISRTRYEGTKCVCGFPRECLADIAGGASELLISNSRFNWTVLLSFELSVETRALVQK